MLEGSALCFIDLYCISIKVTPDLFTAEFFSDNLPDYMEEELHEIFSQLNGQHSRQEAEETQRCPDHAQFDVGFPEHSNY